MLQSTGKRILEIAAFVLILVFSFMRQYIYVTIVNRIAEVVVGGVITGGKKVVNKISVKRNQKRYPGLY